MLLLFRNRASGGDFPPGFNPATDYWWDGSDPSTMWQDTGKTTAVGSGDPVRVWRSKGVALDAIAPSDPARATWDGTNNLVFAGAQEYFAAIGIGTYTPPLTVVVVVQRTVLGVRHSLVTSQTSVNGRLFMFQNNLESSNPNFVLNIPDGLARGVAILSSTLSGPVLRWNSLESTIGFATYAENNLVIGNKGAYASAITFLDGDIATVYVRPGVAADATERAALETWFAAKYGVVLP